MRLLMMLIWLFGSLWWLSSDTLLRDGDEEGHVGAAELFRLQLDGGEWLAFADDAWRGDLGEYPPIYPALVGAWWWLCGSGQPGAVPIRAVNLLGLLLAAWATGQLAGRLHGVHASTVQGTSDPRQAAILTATALVLTLPLANGLSRHFMPEGLLVGWVAFTIWVTVWANDRQSHLSLVTLGVVVGLGLLIKQTFAPLALLPVLVAGRGLHSGWTIVVVTAGLVAGPWYALHWNDQAQYVAHSVQAGPTASQAAQLAYYPAAMAHLIAGPVATIAGLWGAILVWRRTPSGSKRVLAIGLAWILGLVILALIPKKYPRLAAPIAPALAILAGAAAARLRQRHLVPAIVAVSGTAWVTWMSLSPPTDPSWVPIVDEKCPQRWLRPPVSDDMGLHALAEALSTAPPGEVSVWNAPEIPCAVQTTHPWMSHIEPYLRRAGLERVVRAGPSRTAVVQATFLPMEEAVPNDVPVPSLDLALRIEIR